MTLLQLKYALTAAECKTVSEAAKKLYISQPSLTSAIKELEDELGITIFNRTNKGIIISAEGEEFLGYARQVIEQTNLINERYFSAVPIKHRFCVSTQHYSFAVEAFVKLLKEYGGDEYDFRIRETQTYEIIEDVAKLKSEVGVTTYKSRIWPGPWINPEENASSIPVPSVFLYTLLYKLCLPPHKDGSVDGMFEESPRTSWHYGKVSR